MERVTVSFLNKSFPNHFPSTDPLQRQQGRTGQGKGVAMPKCQSIPGETIDEAVGASPTACCRMTTDRVTSSRGESPRH